jgi:hypothetical protein
VKSIKIYLDTQDFANLSKEKIDPKLNPVKEFLIEGTQSGELKIGYSYPIIFELIRNADELHKDDRLRKARLVKLLCGNNAHPYPTDLKAGYRFPNNGTWTPINALNALTPQWLKSNFREGLLKKAEKIEGLTRQQRRKLKSTRGSMDIFSALSIGPLTKDDFPGVPVPEIILKERMIERYVTGRINAQSVISALKRWTTDPENLFELWYEYSNLENPIEKFVTSQFDLLVERIEILRESYRKIQLSNNELIRLNRQIRKIVVKNSLSSDWFQSNPKPITDEQLFSEFENLSDQYFGPGRGDIFKLYFLSMIKSTNSPKGSDLVDLLHLLYLRDVDLFRCDRGMAHHMRSQHFTLGHRIVPSLLDLPERVRELRSSLAGNQID